jgi:hypothetical protein
MKIKIILIVTFFTTLLLSSCSDDIMDKINMEKNNSVDMTSKNLLPSILMRTAFQTTGTDYAWYASLYVEHSVGTWGQQATADKRIAQNDASLFNNNWVSSYSIINTCKVIEGKCKYGGSEFPNFTVYGISEVIEAYNLGVLVDLFGDVPYTEACAGANSLHPKFDKATDLYPKLQSKLDSAIAHLKIGGNSPGSKDYIYGGKSSAWLKAAWSLKARYYMRLSNVDNQASTNVVNCLANAFTTNADALLFNSYDATSAIAENPWFQFLNDRSGLSSSKTLYDEMNLRSDPRIAAYFDLKSGTKWAENGISDENQGGLYYISKMCQDAAAPTPIMSFHELLFIKAEAQFRKSDANWKSSLQKAIEESFVYHGLASIDADTYYTSSVLPRLTSGNELKEIITQKWIALYEAESIEAYNDYRRTNIPTMKNPNNLTTTGGFVNRFPYGLSDVSSNGANVPKIDIYKDKLFWAK